MIPTRNHSKKRVLITGASSFMGAHACRYISQHATVVGVYHSNPIHLPNIESIKIDLTNPRSVRQIQKQNIDIIVHLASKIQNSPKRSAYDCNQSMMSHLLQLNTPMIYCSSTAVHWQSDIPYVRSRKEEEQALQNSKLPFVILRPCAPYGPPLLFHKPKHTESFQTLINIVSHAPVVPVIGDGTYLRQPVHVDDFCALILYYIRQKPDQSVLDVGGSKAYSFDKIISIIQKTLRRSTPILHVPKTLALLAIRAKLFPNLEESLVSTIDVSEAFDIKPILERIPSVRSFEEGHVDLLRFHEQSP